MTCPLKTGHKDTTPARYVVTVMITDTWQDQLHPNVILATSAEWMCVLFYCVFVLLSLLGVISTVLALARYRDSVRSSDRVQFIRDICSEYNMHFSPKPKSEALTKSGALTSCPCEVASSAV